MKILAFTPQYLPIVGGIEIFVDMLARPLRDRSIETVVVTDTDQLGRLPERHVVNDTVVHRLNFLKSIRTRETRDPLVVLRQLFEIVDNEKPDLIHMHSALQASAWFVDRLLKRPPLRLPFILTQHAALEAVDRITIVREFLINADTLTAVSQAALQSALEFSNRTDHSSVIYNGIESLDVTINADRSYTGFRLCCIGRLQLEKGFDVAIAALAKVRALGFGANLIVIGQGELRKSLQKLADNYGVADHVHFAGVLDRRRVLEVIAGCSLVLVPSRMREGFSLVAAEAALSGVPCIASRLGGLPEVVEDKVTGLLVAPGDPDDLASAIVELLGDTERMHRLGEAARLRAQGKFNIETCVEGYLRLYNKFDRSLRGASA